MGRLGLTREERALVAQVAASAESRFQRLWFYSAALVPALGFAGYGIVRGDIVALGVGFAGLLLFTCWHIASEIKAVPVFSALCAKVDALERGDEDA